MNALMRALVIIFGRGVALFVGAMALLGAVRGVMSGVDLHVWWVDLRPMPAMLASLIVGLMGLLLMGFAVRPEMGRWRWRLSVASSFLVCGAAVSNVLVYYRLLLGEAIASSFPVAVSGVVVLGMGVVIGSMFLVKDRSARTEVRAPVRGMGVVFVALCCAFLFPLMQMVGFGKTDYRRPADAIVVFGCRAFADGTPSDALADRVRTGVALFHEGRADVLIFSGGPGDGAVHETEAMRDYAMSLGVPADRIVLDREGLNTDATVRNVSEMMRQRGMRRALAVSHFYHLPRVKLRFDAEGTTVFTVPAVERYTLSQLPYNMMREVAALWVYWGRVVVG